MSPNRFHCGSHYVFPVSYFEGQYTQIHKVKNTIADMGYILWLRNLKTSLLYGCQPAPSSPPITTTTKGCPFIPKWFPMDYCSNSHSPPTHPTPPLKAYRCHSLCFRTVAWPCSIRSSSQTLAFFPFAYCNTAGEGGLTFSHGRPKTVT